MINYINNNNNVRVKYFAEKFNVSKRTIYRDLEAIEQVPDITLEYNGKQGLELYYKGESTKKYNGRKNYIWTTKDLKVLEYLVELNVSDQKIAELLERTVAAIQNKKQDLNIDKKYKMVIDDKIDEKKKKYVYLDQGYRTKALEKYKKETGKNNFSQLINDLLKSYVKYN